MLPRTLAPRGSVGSYRVGTALAPARSHGGGLCCTCQSSRAGSAFLPLPRPDLSQLHCPAHPTQLPPWVSLCSTCFTEWGLYKMGRMGWGWRSLVQPLVALRKCNPSFLPQKLFASVLLDSHFSTNSINSHRPLTHTIFFPARLTPRISFLTDIMNNATSWLWIQLDLTQDYYKVY